MPQPMNLRLESGYQSMGKLARTMVPATRHYMQKVCISG